MTREQKTRIVRNTNEMRRDVREAREVTAAYLGAAAAVLLYLAVVCAVKGYGFTLVGIGAAAVVVGALVSAVAARMAD